MVNLKKVLIAGGSGYIGSQLGNYLQKFPFEVGLLFRDKEFQILNHSSGAKIFSIDGSDIENQLQQIYQNFHPDVTVNCVTFFQRNDDINQILNLVSSNIYFPVALLKNSIIHKSRFINLSSYWQKMDNSETRAKNLYSTTKNSFEEILDYAVAKNYVIGTSVFLKDTFGMNDPRDKIINELFKAVVHDRHITLTSPDNEINLTYVNDVILGIKLIIELQDLERSYELSNDKTIKLSELIRTVAKVANKSIKVNWNNKFDGNQNLLAQKKIAPRPQGWMPMTSIEQGLAEIYEKS